MTPARFLETRASAWNRLEVIVSKAFKKGVRALSDKELHELTRLYPAVAPEKPWHPQPAETTTSILLPQVITGVTPSWSWPLT